MLSHGNIVANAMNMKAEAPFETATIYLHAAPMFHLADCSATFALTDAGGTHTFVPRFDPLAVMRLIQDLRVTNSILVPAMIGMLVNHPAIGDYDLTSLRGSDVRRAVHLGGDPPPRDALPAALRLPPGLRHDRAVAGGDVPAAALSHDRRASTPAASAPPGAPRGRREIRIVDDQDQRSAARHGRARSSSAARW